MASAAVYSKAILLFLYIHFCRCIFCACGFCDGVSFCGVVRCVISSFFTRIALAKAGLVMGPFVDHLCYLCLVFVMLSRLFIAALWSPAVKGLTSRLLFVMLNCVLVTFPRGILGQVYYLSILIPYLCRLSY